MARQRLELAGRDPPIRRIDKVRRYLTPAQRLGRIAAVAFVSGNDAADEGGRVTARRGIAVAT